MQSRAAARRHINRDAELAYWRGLHARGRLGEHDFQHYERLLVIGYDIYQAHPRANEEQLYHVLKDSYRRHRESLPLSWDEARWLVRHAWHHAEQGQGPN